jgi:hypothetical protein
MTAAAVVCEFNGASGDTGVTVDTLLGANTDKLTSLTHTLNFYTFYDLRS